MFCAFHYGTLKTTRKKVKQINAKNLSISFHHILDLCFKAKCLVTLFFTRQKLIVHKKILLDIVEKLNIVEKMTFWRFNKHFGPLKFQFCLEKTTKKWVLGFEMQKIPWDVFSKRYVDRIIKKSKLFLGKTQIILIVGQAKVPLIATHSYWAMLKKSLEKKVIELEWKNSESAKNNS